MIVITDGNNYARRMFEIDQTGMAFRNIIRELEFATDIHIWIWDSYNANKRRRDIFPDYKARRVSAGEDMFKSMKLLKDVLTHTSAIQVEVPTYEADDVIATIVKSMNDKVHIRSTDRDFLQLGVPCDATPYPNVAPDLITLYKICVGDPSDNIPGVARFGKKTWEQADKTQLQDLINRILKHALLRTEEKVEGVPQSVVDWITTHQDDIRKYAAIVAFFDVPQDLMDVNTKVGDCDYQKADQILQEFIL